METLKLLHEIPRNTSSTLERDKDTELALWSAGPRARTCLSATHFHEPTSWQTLPTLWGLEPGKCACLLSPDGWAGDWLELGWTMLSNSPSRWSSARLGPSFEVHLGLLLFSLFYQKYPDVFNRSYTPLSFYSIPKKCTYNSSYFYLLPNIIVRM